MPSSSSARVGVVICVVTRPASGRNSKLPSLQPSSRNKRLLPFHRSGRGVDDVASRRCTRPRTARPSNCARRSSNRAGAPIQVEELEQVHERDLRQAPPDDLARFLHHRIQLGSALRQLGDALAHVIGVGVGGDRQRAPLFGAARGRLADEHETHAPRAGLARRISTSLAASISSSRSAVMSTSGTSRRAVSSAAAPCGQICVA